MGCVNSFNYCKPKLINNSQITTCEEGEKQEQYIPKLELEV